MVLEVNSTRFSMPAAESLSKGTGVVILFMPQQRGPSFICRIQDSAGKTPCILKCEKQRIIYFEHPHPKALIGQEM